MTKTKKSYGKFRFVTVLLTTIMLPFGTFVGYEFGAGHTQIALIALLIQTLLTATQSYIWWLTIEKVK